MRKLLLRLHRFLAADPGRFAGATAVRDPLGLQAVEAEQLKAQDEGEPPDGPAGDQGTGQGLHGRD
jgi:hypothetical protein